MLKVLHSFANRMKLRDTESLVGRDARLYIDKSGVLDINNIGFL
jgi:hypothetical protein